MNSILQLKGPFNKKSNSGGGGPINLPTGKSVTEEHLLDLQNQLSEVLHFWQNENLFNGALVAVFYNSVVAKSNRIKGLLSYKMSKPWESVRGAKFVYDDAGVNAPKHVFIHFVGLDVIKESIRRLALCAKILNEEYGGEISSEDIDKLNKKTRRYNYAPELALTNFIYVIVDAYYVSRFDVDKKTVEIPEGAIITVYKTNVNTEELLSKIGIQMASVKMLNDTTFRLDYGSLELLRGKAPYLIAMQTPDFSTYTLGTPTYCDKAVCSIPSPTNEPVVGVIDTLFYKDVYFGEWVEYKKEIDDDISLDEDDYYHGTAVSSIIVDGPSLNPDMEDGCGRFRVKHFGVSKNGKFSSFSILQSIRRVVSQNPDIKVWNLSLGSDMEINVNFISPEAAELDRIQCDYDVIFIVAGTNRTDYEKETQKIGAPADSLNSLVVNSVNFENQPASYHRVGPVLEFFHKPDVSYYGGDAGGKIKVYTPSGEQYNSGTSYAAPWITRKVAYLIYKMRFSREVAKALIIDSAAGWNRQDGIKSSVGYGVVPKHINDIVKTSNDEIRFVMVGASESYETYTYNIPVPYVGEKHPFYARATLCYFPECSRNQGVDYTNTEMDIHFGRVYEGPNGPAIKSINGNKQGDAGTNVLYEGPARKEYRKWDNVKHINDELKKSPRPLKKYGAGHWGLSVKTKERLQIKREKALPFGVVITLKEMNGINRIDEFIKLCMIRGWIVNRIDVDNRVDVYNISEEEVTLD